MKSSPTIKLETPFDHLTALLCDRFDVPFGLVSVVDEDLAVFRSELGLGERSLPREISVSSILVSMGSGAHLVIEDAALHPVLKNHPMVAGAPFIRSFAGATISNGEGRPIGAVGVMDVQPRGPLSAVEIAVLQGVAQVAGSMLDQAAAQRARLEQVELLTLAEQIAGIGHFRLDAATGKVSWSDEVYRIHGLEPGSIDPSLQCAIGTYAPGDAEIVAGLITRALATGEGYEARLRIIRPDGEERVTRAKARCERDEAGKVTAVFGVFQDITESVRAHDAVVASETRYRLLADRTTDIIGVYDLDGRFRYLSPAMEMVLGYVPEEMLGRTTWEFIDPRDHETIRQAYRRHFTLGPTAVAPRIPYRAIHKDGSLVWLEAHPTVVWDDQGQPVEIQDAIRDISQRVALEADLIAARDVAEAGARAKSEFLANMSHELRTPLTSVIGFSGLLRGSDNLPAAERTYADRIATASDALLSVINDILDYSKLEAEAVDLEPQPFDPRAMAEGAAAIVEDLFKTKGLTLVVDVADNLASALMGDEGRLRQVTLNFLSNAVKFTGTGTVTLHVSDAAGRLRVAVTDSGIGISPDKIAMLFDRFTQADASTTRVYGGTGLGLAISHRLIEMMGGVIGADSQPGQGSTFWFEVPLTSAGIAAMAPVPVVSSLPSGVRILIADDASANRELVTAIMAGFDVDLDAVRDGAEAVEAARNGGYDLILMDVHMPVMDGLEATRAIRAMGGAVGRTPIVALTANVQPEHVERCREAGMDAHVGKPIQVVDLFETISAVLTRANNQPDQKAVA